MNVYQKKKASQTASLKKLNKAKAMFILYKHKVIFYKHNVRKLFKTVAVYKLRPASMTSLIVYKHKKRSTSQ